MTELLKDATARPWKVGPYGGIYPVNSNKHGGPMIVSALTKSGHLPNHVANELLTVTAVNSYEPMLAALEAVLGRYVDLVNCGDCGHWNPETEDEVIAARAAIALAKLEGEKP